MKKIILLSILFILTLRSFGHGGEDHSKSNKRETVISDSIIKQPDTANSMNLESGSNLHNDVDMSAFATYHPLIVHFPIVLLIILPFFQLVSFFKLKKEIGWAVVILTGAGLVSSYLASNSFHPHTVNLTPQANEILEKHDYYAYLTVWISLVALVAKLSSQFVFRLNKWSECLVLICLFLAAYSVTMAGHHGSQLTHIHGVGPQGKFLQMNHH